MNRALPTAASISVRVAGAAAIERVLNHVRERGRLQSGTASGVPAAPVHHGIRPPTATALLRSTETRKVNGFQVVPLSERGLTSNNNYNGVSRCWIFSTTFSGARS